MKWILLSRKEKSTLYDPSSPPYGFQARVEIQSVTHPLKTVRTLLKSEILGRSTLKSLGFVLLLWQQLSIGTVAWSFMTTPRCTGYMGTTPKTMLAAACHLRIPPIDLIVIWFRSYYHLDTPHSKLPWGEHLINFLIMTQKSAEATKKGDMKE